MKLSPIQEKIVETPGNLIVRASAGTGKTHTMVNKIAKEIDDNHTHKVIAAITFTIKAAQEIKDRLSVDVVQHFIGTNNSFVIEEVIKPFMKDVYGADFDLDMSTDYSAKVDTFQEAIEKIRNEGILCSYRDNKRNFIFDLAQEIVENSSACRLYLQAKYFKIYIDEYQDCDKSMHKFFMYLCDELNIETFVVGDEKQSIYIWRGAYPEAFKSIWNKPNFKKIFMGDNFRSCQQIQNYSNLLCDETRSLYNPTENIDNIVWLSPTKANWASKMWQYVIDTHENDREDSKRYYVAGVFNELVNKSKTLTEGEAVNLLMLNPKRLDMLLHFGYKGDFHQNTLLNIVIKEFIKKGKINEAVSIVEFRKEIWIKYGVEYLYANFIKCNPKYKKNTLRFWRRLQKISNKTVAVYAENTLKLLIEADSSQRACDIISIKLDSKKIASYVENIMSEILEAGNTVMKNIDNFMDEEGNVNVEEVRSAIQEERRKLKKR